MHSPHSAWSSTPTAAGDTWGLPCLPDQKRSTLRRRRYRAKDGTDGVAEVAPHPIDTDGSASPSALGDIARDSEQGGVTRDDAEPEQLRVAAVCRSCTGSLVAMLPKKSRVGRRNPPRAPKRNALGPPETRLSAPEQSPFATPDELSAWSASLPSVAGASFGLQPDGYVNVPDLPDIVALAERVKARRKELGVSQAGLARRGGPSAGTIGEIERCRNPLPLPETLDKLDHALGWEPNTSDTILRGGVAGHAVETAAARGRLRLVVAS